MKTSNTIILLIITLVAALSLLAIAFFSFSGNDDTSSPTTKEAVTPSIPGGNIYEKSDIPQENKTGPLTP